MAMEKKEEKKSIIYYVNAVISITGCQKAGSCSDDPSMYRF
jgi:hypothetical protein